MTILPFAKLKPGMLCLVRLDGREVTGRIFEKHDGTKTLRFYFGEAGFEHAEPIPFEDVLGRVTPDPFQQIHPTLSKSVTDYKHLTVEKLVLDPSWVFEKKHDGERIIAAYFPSWIAVGGSRCTTTCRITSRVLEVDTGLLGDHTPRLPHFAQMPVGWDGPTVLDAEILSSHGATRRDRSKSLSSVLRSLPARALEVQQRIGKLHMEVFDAYWLNGEDLRELPFQERRARLEEWYREAVTFAREEGWDDFGHLVRLSYVARTEEEKRALLARIQEEGEEGAMGKRLAGKLCDTTTKGNRSPDVLKVKPFTETDVIITGFVMGKGEYNGDRYGAIQLAQYVHRSHLRPGMELFPSLPADAPPRGYSVILEAHSDDPLFLVNVGTCGGFTQAEEESFRAIPEAFIGQPVEVSYQEGGRFPDTARFRHAHFERMRPDKNAFECIYVPEA